jgi:hypothetical protein
VLKVRSPACDHRVVEPLGDRAYWEEVRSLGACPWKECYNPGLSWGHIFAQGQPQMVILRPTCESQTHVPTPPILIEIGLANFFSRLVLNCDPPNLYLPSHWNYRCELPCPVWVCSFSRLIHKTYPCFLAHLICLWNMEDGQWNGVISRKTNLNLRWPWESKSGKPMKFGDFLVSFCLNLGNFRVFLPPQLTLGLWWVGRCLAHVPLGEYLGTIPSF